VADHEALAVGILGLLLAVPLLGGHEARHLAVEAQARRARPGPARPRTWPAGSSCRGAPRSRRSRRCSSARWPVQADRQVGLLAAEAAAPTSMPPCSGCGPRGDDLLLERGDGGDHLEGRAGVVGLGRGSCRGRGWRIAVDARLLVLA
jgi:hypothetical protein